MECELQDGERKRGTGSREVRLARALEGFGKLFRECAGRALRTTLLRRTLVFFSTPLPAWGSSASSIHLTRRPGRPRTFRSRRLRLVRTQQPIFERRAVEAPDDRVHFF